MLGLLLFIISTFVIYNRTKLQIILATIQQSSTYFTHKLSSGLTIALLPSRSQVIYCGVVIGVGSRHDPSELSGLAHFAEHTIFKGTTRRKSWHILSRMEVVGGELNAYTTKEETFVYASAPRAEVRRALELLADIVLHCTFPPHEVEKERDVVLDEINLYKDTPSDQIFDDFEEYFFNGHPLAHPILGDRAGLMRIGSPELRAHASRAFHAQNMVLFVMGRLTPERFVRLAEEYFGDTPSAAPSPIISQPLPQVPAEARRIVREEDTHQTHYMLGGLAPSMHALDRMEMALLMSWLGGASMNSRLNLSLREKYGYVYSVEANHTPLTDTGWWHIYFGCDPNNAPKAERAMQSVLDRLLDEGIAPSRLAAWAKQIKGSLALSSEQAESCFLNFGKQILHFGRYASLAEVYDRIDRVTPDSILKSAREWLPTHTLTLIFAGKKTDY